MCGIAGFIGFKDDSLIHRMNDKQSHRGPDFTSHYIDEEISLGHTRLSIIDLSSSANQPIYNEDKSIVSIYNGEIYNYKKIKSDLESRGHKFISKTDSEVIVHAYEEYGTKSFSIFNGMFAFALWDKSEKKLFIVRDRLGIKPVYYFYDNQMFIFASEIKSIIESKHVEKKINNESLIDYLTYQNVIGNKTFFKDISMVEPGSYVEYFKGNIRTERYWDLQFKPDNKISLASALRNFRRTFLRSVKRHLMSDVPLGSYLSSGFDSSSVSVLASKLKGDRIRTYTARFDNGPHFDESRLAEKISNTIGSEHYTLTITPSDFVNNLRETLYSLDEPKVGPSVVAQYIIAKKASESVKVILTGHGGDELFCGYPSHKAFYAENVIRKDWTSLLEPHKLFKKGEFKFFIYFSFLKLIQPQIQWGLPILFTRQEMKKLFTEKYYQILKHIDPDKSISNIIGDKNLTNLERLQYLQIKTYLPSLFVLEDKISMAHSLESRTPICDNEMLKIALTSSFSNRIHKNHLKFFIKQTMKKHLPRELYFEHKRGFSMPISKWFRDDLKSFIEDLLLSPKLERRGIFNIKYVKKLLSAHFRTKVDNPLSEIRAHKLWILINLELWFQRFIDN